jgi:superfamily II DNA or RNA helicase
MTFGLKLRPFQREGLDALTAAHRRGVVTPALVFATGLGKTVTFGFGAVEHHLRTGQRVLALAHRTELVEQAAGKLEDIAPTLRTGIVMGNRNDTMADLVVASPQTLRTESRRRQLSDVGLVICDEAHHYAAPLFREVRDYFLSRGAVSMGVTATMSRGDALPLGDVWAEVVATRDIQFGIQSGYLVRPRALRVAVDGLSLKAVRRKGSDYEPDALADALSASLAPKRIAEALRTHAPRGRVVVFAPSIRSAEELCDVLRQEGFPSDVVHYRTPAADRKRILADHAAGRLQVVCNAMVLTEGWDCPPCDTAVIMRPTTSNGLYVQMVGRILRPYPGKTSALVLDVCGASEHNTLQAAVELFGPEMPDAIERDPCTCGPMSLLGSGLCPCGRGACTDRCACGGGRPDQCWCKRPEKLEVPGSPDTVYQDGTLTTEAVDLFHGSRNQWLSTYGAGIFFLALGQRYVAIMPTPDARWDVLSVPADSGPPVPIRRGLHDLGIAQGYAEASVTPTERRLTAKSRTWRAREASSGQRYTLRMLGLQAPDGAHAGEVSTMIDTAKGSARLEMLLALGSAGQF